MKYFQAYFSKQTNFKTELGAVRTACILTISLLIGSLTNGADLEVHVSNISEARGQVVVWVFDQGHAKSFPDKGEHAVCELEIPVPEHSTNNTVLGEVCTDLVEGDYATVVFHDTNSNGKIDHNFLGFPKEDLGFFNGCKAGLPVPNFKKCHLGLTQSGSIIKTSLKSIF